MESHTCKRCTHAEYHGYPPEGAPEWYCFTVYMMCGKGRAHIGPHDTCDCYEEGQPAIVRDDADW